jgi:uncharacterized RDD family membrane protein YckC
MFYILGGDGKEYGPAAPSQVRSWMAAGRASLETKARSVTSEEWKTLGDFPEFNDALRSAPPGVAAEPPASPGVSAVDTSDLASCGARTGAALINAFIYLISTIPGGVVMSRKLLEQQPELAKGGFPRFDKLDMVPLMEAVAWVWAGIFAAVLLQGLLIAVRRQNLGKLICGGRVVRASDGQPASLVQAVLLRFFLPVAIVILLHVFTLVLGVVFLVVDYCFMFREDRRCLHDLIAGTKVVRT